MVQHNIDQAVVKGKRCVYKLPVIHTENTADVQRYVELLPVKVIRLLVQCCNIAHSIHPVVPELIIFRTIGDQVIFIFTPAQRYGCGNVKLAVFTIDSLFLNVVIKVFE